MQSSSFFSMPAPLLDYDVSTNPRPLQISSIGAITIIVDNPGGYSDQPAQDYVAIASIVFDFGAAGSGGGNLTPVAGESFQVTPPVGWGAPTIVGLQFTFTPPTGGANLFPSGGLQFTFGQIPVNATVGTVQLTITETASSPGDPGQPDVYPPMPEQARSVEKPIGKFPLNFTVGDLLAQPPNVPVGGSATLSWTGSPGAIYEIDYGAAKITQHANGTALQPNDIYPNSAAGDAPLALEVLTPFTLTVTYTPPGGSDPAIFQRQVNVGVYYPNPVIQSFTATPTFIPVGPTGSAVVTLSWSVQYGKQPDCVAFTITPPLPTYPATGTGLQQTITQSQLITLTAYGADGTTPATQSYYILIGRAVNISAGIGSYAGSVAASPDGAYAFVTNMYDATVSVVATPGTDITQWSTVATLSGFPPNPQSVAVASSSFGTFALVTTASNGGQLSVISMSSAPPSQWPVVALTAGLGQNAVDVAVSPDGLHIFVACSGAQSFPGPLSTVSILTVNGSDPTQWPVINITSGSQQSLITQVSVSPRGDYAFFTVVDNTGMNPDSVGVISLSGPNPAQWPVVATIPGVGQQTTAMAVSADGKTGLVANFQGSAVQVVDLSSSSPSQWHVSAAITNGVASPTDVAFSADGTYAFVSNIENNFVSIIGVSSAPPASWPVQQLSQNVGGRPHGVATSARGSIAFVANDNGGPGGSLTVISLEQAAPSAPLAAARPTAPIPTRKSLPSFARQKRK